MQLNDIRGTSSKAADASGRGYASSRSHVKPRPQNVTPSANDHAFYSRQLLAGDT